MTQKSAWEEIAGFLPRGKTIWECFWGDGKSGEYLRELIQSQAEQGRRINQLLGYSLNAESDRLTLQERLILLENRVKKLENG